MRSTEDGGAMKKINTLPLNIDVHRVFQNGRIMSNGNLNKVKELLQSAFAYAKQNEISSPIGLAQLGELIRYYDKGFTPLQYGHEKLRSLLETMPDVIEVVRDDSISPPRFFANYLGAGLVNSQAVAASQTPIQAGMNRDLIPKDLSEFAFIIKTKWQDLADLALDEFWGGSDLPLLRNYIKYTFFRLVSENKDKVKIADDRGMAAFNTGLVDRRFQPIYALLKKNNKAGTAPWFLESFCVAGENFNGKALVRTFNPLPEAAYYFDSPADAFYDIYANVYIDWEHIIEENADRIPPELLSRTTRGFDVKSRDDIGHKGIDEYKRSLGNYLKDDAFAYRMLIDSFNRALELALKKVRWNYKTAIPIYFPTKNGLSMLLPLCILSADRVDLALVVERTESGNYQGHTVYPLDWAYSNSRLIARPDSDWLQAASPAAEHEEFPDEQS